MEPSNLFKYVNSFLKEVRLRRTDRTIINDEKEISNEFRRFFELVYQADSLNTNPEGEGMQRNIEISKVNVNDVIKTICKLDLL